MTALGSRSFPLIGTLCKYEKELCLEGPMIWKCGRWPFIRLPIHLPSSFHSFLTSRSSKVFGYVRWYDRYNLQYSAPQSSLAPLYPAFSPGQNLSMVRAVSPYLPWVLFVMNLTSWGRCLWYTSWRDKNHSHSLSPAPQLLFSDTAPTLTFFVWSSISHPIQLLAISRRFTIPTIQWSNS